MHILSLESLSFQFPGAQRAALSTIHYQVEKHDFIILLGGNGSGKSTLLQLLRRSLKGYQGNILLHGQSIDRYSNREYCQKVNLLTQDCSDSLFNALTIYENYLLVKNNFFAPLDNEKEKQFLQTYLADFNPNLAGKINHVCTALSGGEKQALALAFCLLQAPEILLLDEHTSALDPKTSEQIMLLTDRKIREQKITCILTTHDLDIALHYGNRIIVLADGKIHRMFDREEKAHLSKDKLFSSFF